MAFRIVYFILLSVFLSGTASCQVKRKEYIERNGLHSDKKPKEIAAELGARNKKAIRRSKRDHRKEWKAIEKRNRKKVAGKYFDK
jgi:hypothetical protein